MTQKELRLKYKFETGLDVDDGRNRFFFIDPKYRTILDYLDWLEERTLKLQEQHDKLIPWEKI